MENYRAMYLLVGSVVLIDVPTDDDSIDPNEFLDREIVSRKKLGEFTQSLLFTFISRHFLDVPISFSRIFRFLGMPLLLHYCIRNLKQMFPANCPNINVEWDSRNV